MMLAKVFTEPVFDADVLFIMGHPKEFLFRQALKNKIKTQKELDTLPESFAGTMLANDKDSGSYLLYVRADGDLNTLLHEICHLAFSVMRTRQIEDEETHCYYIDHWYSRLSKYYQKEKQAASLIDNKRSI